MENRIIKGLVLFVSIFITFTLNAQDTLPGFKVTDKGNGRVVISWKNNFETLSQVSVQRSYDSIKKFTTIYSAPSPELPENGYPDQLKTGQKVYYRIFFVLQGGTYFFTESKSPSTAMYFSVATDTKRDKATELIREAIKSPSRKTFIKVADSLYATLIDGDYLRFKDSIMNSTKDTLFPLSSDTIQILQYVAPYVWKSSNYVYTNKEGYVVINLPEALTRKYELRIFEQDENPVPILELKHIKNSYLTLDKTNFYHAGWYRFELIEDGKIKDRNKILIPKDF
ncbi:MAG: hypothetical protein ABIX01_07730 [Chitinophagaceae bacterium]